MATDTKFRAALTVTLLGLIMVTFAYFQKDAVYTETSIQLKHMSDSLKVTETSRDSLRDELFILQVELGRHEITREYFFNRHPQLQIEYENFINHETE
jgi:hypothetical protein